MNRHTPGPWHVNGIDSKRGRITGDETSIGWDKLQVHGANRTVATVYRPADGRLIAAAPELLAALTELLASHDRTCKGEECQLSGIDLARAAIAKATGEAP